MKTLPLLTIAAVLLLITGCGTPYYRDDSAINVGCTDNCMTFNVKITTGEGSITPLANTLVELEWSESSVGRLIGRGVTAADGTISFSFKAKEEELHSGSYYITAQRGGGYITQSRKFYVTNGSAIVNTEIHVPSIATLKVVYKNFNPVADGDYFSCNRYYNGGTYTRIGRSFTKNGGAFTQIEEISTTAGNQYTYFDIKRIKNGITTITKDSAFVGRGQTKIYEIEY
ncbi:hypothetical protein [Flexibacter flexilis]|nr:hypothetical protein [Flexibacter flexilis]